MDMITNMLFNLPFIKGPYDYVMGIKSMDFMGQQKAERTYQVILTVFGIVGFFWGFYIQQLSATVYTVLAGFALSCIIVLPPWPYFARNQLNWMPAVESKKKTEKNKKSDGKSKKK